MLGGAPGRMERIKQEEVKRFSDSDHLLVSSSAL